MQWLVFNNSCIIKSNQIQNKSNNYRYIYSHDEIRFDINGKLLSLDVIDRKTQKYGLNIDLKTYIIDKRVNSNNFRLYLELM